MRVERIDEVEGEGDAVAIRLDVWQRSGTTVKCFPRSHARAMCKVAAIAPMPENGPAWAGALPITAFVGVGVENSHSICAGAGCRNVGGGRGCPIRSLEIARKSFAALRVRRLRIVVRVRNPT